MDCAILITARLKSRRLPKKALLPIQGRSMLGHMVDRLRLAKHPGAIILCTSPLPEDDPLAAFAEAEGILSYRGHPDDVLERLTSAAQKFDVGTVISCTADNPFVDPEYIDFLVDFHWANRHDFTRVEGLPWGVFAYAIERAAMERAITIKDEVDTEVWGGYFTQTGLFSVGVMEVADGAVRRPEYRLTVDEPADFELVTQIFDALLEPGKVFPLADIVRLLDENPELAAVNAEVAQAPGKPIRVKGK
ncbi:MAG: NTP transferase domain-containing protein [Proteobacteria bacterium]|nr:NTP transferase domain-containing protein [Pseudomonadota bacterium]